MELEFSRQIKGNLKIPRLMTLRLVRVELLHSGGRTNMTKVMVTFRIHANAYKNGNINNFGFTMPSLGVSAFAL
jgi:hypothetical protein